MFCDVRVQIWQRGLGLHLGQPVEMSFRGALNRNQLARMSLELCLVLFAIPPAFRVPGELLVLEERQIREIYRILGNLFSFLPPIEQQRARRPHFGSNHWSGDE